jgi:hypothetical protein
MDIKSYGCAVGALIVNLQSLEFSLRQFLDDGKDAPPPEGLTSGEWVAETPLTNWDPLGALIDKYNAVVRPPHPDLVVDRSMVELRDSLAHGRVFSPTPTFPVRLLRFDKPERRRVLVRNVTVLTEEWFQRNVREVYAQIKKVEEARLRMSRGRSTLSDHG